jgi:general secretion pathway protein E
MSSTVATPPLDDEEIDVARAGNFGVIASIATQRDVDEDAACAMLAAFLGLQHWCAADFQRYEPRFDLLTLAKAVRRCAVVFADADGRLFGVLSDPFDEDLIALLTAASPGPTNVTLATSTAIRAFLEQWPCYRGVVTRSH